MKAKKTSQRVFVVQLLLLFACCIRQTECWKEQHRVAVNSGLNDAVAIVGKVFRYTIPTDAFSGQVDHYEVTEAGGSSLQKWLMWSPERLELVGIPSEEDSGPNYIQVTAVAMVDSNVKDQHNYADTRTSQRKGVRAKDVFSIHVSDEYRPQQEKSIPQDERITCQHGPASTMTLLFADDTETLKVSDKVELITRLAHVLGEKEGVFRLVSNNDYTFSSLRRVIHLAGESPAYATGGEITPSAASTSGKNDTNLAHSGSNFPAVTWLLTCGSSVPTRETSYALDWLLSKEGDPDYFKRKFGHQLLSWYVASISYEPKRRRRQHGYVTPYSNVGPTGNTYEINGAVITRFPTTSSSTARTPTVRIRPTGFVTSSSFDWKTSPTSRRPVVTTGSRSSPSSSSSGTTRTRGSTRTTRTTTTPMTVITRKPGDAKPTLKNSLGVLYCRQNIVCYLPIPADTFYDPEDGDTTKLTLRLDALGDVGKQPSWLRLDDTRQMLIGLPLQAGNFLFRLTAIDQGNRQASDAFSVEVKEDPLNEDQLSHRVFIHFTVPDEKNFTKDVRYRIRLMQKLAQYYGDSSADKIRVNSLSENGFVLSWSNISLPMDTCPRDEIQHIRDRLLLEDGQVRNQLKRFMEPRFLIDKVNVDEGGACLERAVIPPSPSTTMGVTNSTDDSAETTVITSSSPSEDTFFISTILPAVIITIFLIVATLVACLLYRRNRQHKKGRIESKSEFVSKGTPVIFPDEVELDKESMAATPMLLKDEKPPLQPLEFAPGGGGSMHGNGNGSAAVIPMRTPMSGKPPSMGPGRALGKTHVSEAETELWQKPLLQDVDENPLYRPPPAFEPAGVKENRSPRPKHASPQQRDPPPYVPP